MFYLSYPPLRNHQRYRTRYGVRWSRRRSSNHHGTYEVKYWDLWWFSVIGRGLGFFRGFRWWALSFFVQIEENVHGWFLWLKFIAKARENSFSPSVIIQMLVKSCLLTRSRCPKRGWSLSLPANLRRWCWCYCCLLFRIKIYVRCSTKGRFSWHFHPAGGHASLGRDIFATGRCGNWEAGKVRYYFRADVWEKIGRNQKNTKMNGALITC